MTIMHENKKVINNLCYVIISYECDIDNLRGLIWETYRLHKFVHLDNAYYLR